MTAIHLAAKHGHNQILDVLKAHVSLKVTSTKVGNITRNIILKTSPILKIYDTNRENIKSGAICYLNN